MLTGGQIKIQIYLDSAFPASLLATAFKDYLKGNGGPAGYLVQARPCVKNPKTDIERQSFNLEKITFGEDVAKEMTITVQLQEATRTHGNDAVSGCESLLFAWANRAQPFDKE